MWFKDYLSTYFKKKNSASFVQSSLVIISLFEASYPQAEVRTLFPSI
jgi:hypothetical protein